MIMGKITVRNHLDCLHKKITHNVVRLFTKKNKTAIPSWDATPTYQKLKLSEQITW